MPASRTATPVLRTDTAKNAGSAVSVLVTSTALVANNPSRVSVTITNDHATQAVYVSFGNTAVANTGLRLLPVGGTFTTTAYSGAINAISVGGTSTVLVVEF